MKKATVKILVLSAAIVAPQLIAPTAEAVKVKHLEQLSAEEYASLDAPNCKFIFDSEVGTSNDPLEVE